MKKIFVLLFFIFVISDNINFCQDSIYLRQNGTPRMITFKEGVQSIVKINFIDFLKKELQTDPLDTFLPMDTIISPNGTIHFSFQQYFKKLKVLNGEYVIHTRNNSITSINGNYIRIPEKVESLPPLSNEEAFRILLTTLEDQDGLKKEVIPNIISKLRYTCDTIIWSNWKGENIQLAYKFTLEGNKTIRDQVICINAINGKLIDKHYLLDLTSADGTADTYYSGDDLAIKTDLVSNTYYLRDISRGSTTIEVKNLDDHDASYKGSAEIFTDANNVWTSAEYENGSEDMAALDVMWGLQRTWDYFHDTHSWHSYNGTNGTMTGYVHWYDPYYGMDNAGSLYGDYLFGDGIIDPVVALDIVGHEFAHGISKTQINFNNSGEPGAINEGLSDIWGACVEDYVNMGKDIWINADEIPVIARDLEDPHNTENPDTYGEGDPYWGEEIHLNSTVLSHWFYLLSEGAADENSNGDPYVVSSIGIEKAAHIVFLMETEDYFVSSSDFEDAKLAAIEVAAEEYGYNSNEYIQVTNAWYAVGIGDEVPNLIMGDTIICNSSYQYSLPVEFENETITWSTSANLQIISGQNSRTVTVSKYGSTGGSGTITATYNHGAGNIECEMAVWIGVPTLYYIVPESGEYGYPGNSYGFAIWPAYYNLYPWEYYCYTDPYADVWSLEDCYAQIYFEDPGNYDIYAYATNSCGTSNTVDYSGFLIMGDYFSLSPNPASDEVAVTISENPELDSSTSDQEHNVIIFDMYGTTMINKKYFGDKFAIPIRNLKDGNYFIRISNGRMTLTKKLIIK